MHCDFAFWVGGHARERGRRRRTGAAAGGGRHQGVHGLLHRLAAGRGRRGRRRDPEAARAGAPPSIPRTSSGCASGSASASRTIPRSHPVWRDEIAALQCTERLVRHRRGDRRAHPRAPHLHRRGDRLPRRPQAQRHLRGDAAPPDHDRRRLRPARHEAADEPAGARGAPPRRHLARHCGRRRRRPRLRPCAAHAGGEGASLIRSRRRA